MLLRGPEERNEYGKCSTVLTDWRNLKINGVVVFTEPRSLSFQRSFAKQIPVERNDILQIEVEYRSHSFAFHEFSFLKSQNLWYLVTGNLLLFFLIYRLLSCLAKHVQSRASDALLLVAFFSGVFVPLIFVSDEVASQRENRTLAVRPELKEFLKENSNTGGGYEKWFSDHMGGRVALLKLHDMIRAKLQKVIQTKTASAFYIEENGWLFDFTPSRPPSLIQSVTRTLKTFDNFCKANKIKLFLLEVPRKEVIYSDFYYGTGNTKRGNDRLETIHQNIRTEARENGLQLVCPLHQLLDGREEDYVFFKTTQHWTDWGAYIGYRELMKEIKKDFPDMPVVSLDDYRRSRNQLVRDGWYRHYEFGRLYRLFNFSDAPHNSAVYNYYDHKNSDKMVVKVGKYTKDYTYPEGKYKIMLIGTSQCDNLTQFLPYSAAQTKYIRVNNGQVKMADEMKILKLYKKDILNFKPDILILCFFSWNYPQMPKICNQ